MFQEERHEFLVMPNETSQRLFTIVGKADREGYRYFGDRQKLLGFGKGLRKDENTRYTKILKFYSPKDPTEAFWLDMSSVWIVCNS